MVHILTGGRDCGKTRAIERLYCDQGRGDGIISPKRFADGRLSGYSVRRLSTGAEMPLAEIDPSLCAEWDEVYRLGNFSFSGKGVTFANFVLDEMRRNGTAPLYVDEVGLLELSGRGFALDESLFNSGADVYVTVRDRYLEEVIHKYRLRDYKIIRVDGGPVTPRRSPGNGTPGWT